MAQKITLDELLSSTDALVAEAATNAAANFDKAAALGGERKVAARFYARSVAAVAGATLAKDDTFFKKVINAKDVDAVNKGIRSMTTGKLPK